MKATPESLARLDEKYGGYLEGERVDALFAEFEIRFAAVASGTEVVLTHSGWEALGEKAEAERNGYDNGWETVFVAAFPGYVKGLKS